MRVTPYGVKPTYKQILNKIARPKKSGYVKLYIPFDNEWDNNEEEQ